MNAHIEFIAVAYGLTALVVVAMIFVITRDHRALRAALERLPARDDECDAP